MGSNGKMLQLGMKMSHLYILHVSNGFVLRTMLLRYFSVVWPIYFFYSFVFQFSRTSTRHADCLLDVCGCSVQLDFVARSPSDVSLLKVILPRYVFFAFAGVVTQADIDDVTGIRLPRGRNRGRVI